MDPVDFVRSQPVAFVMWHDDCVNLVTLAGAAEGLMEISEMNVKDAYVEIASDM